MRTQKMIMLAVLVTLVIRPWYGRWGATDEEVAMALPGDDLIADAPSIALGRTKICIDAWEDSLPAVPTYQHLGFDVYERKMEEDTRSIRPYLLPVRVDTIEPTEAHPGVHHEGSCVTTDCACLLHWVWELSRACRRTLS